MTKEIDLDDFLSAEAQRIALGFMQELDEAGDVVGAEYKYDLALHVLANFLGATVFRLLNERSVDKLTKKEQAQVTMDNYATFKRGAQDAIAYGFQSSLSTYSGLNIEYYCKIVPVPEVKSKLQC